MSLLAGGSSSGTDSVPRWMKQTLLEIRQERSAVQEHVAARSPMFQMPFHEQHRRWRRSGNASSVDTAPTKPMGEGIWHTSTIDSDIDHQIDVRCGEIHLGPERPELDCTPLPDAFNPCEDVMGNAYLRVLVWFVVILAFVGNLVVLVITFSSRYKFTVPKFLMCNLSFSDLLMGLYLLLLAGVDAAWAGEYFNFAVQWQYEGGCSFAGFLAVFSACLSTYTLTLMTVERWYTIRNAIHVRYLGLKQVCPIMFGGWVFSAIMALLPNVGVSGYQNTSICLPMKANGPGDITYLGLLLAINIAGFCIISGCYIAIYWGLRGSSANVSNHHDITIAKRMAALVATNFVCLFPIAFFGLTAAFGYPLINITGSKILLVVFFPINCCANPILYAFTTKLFRKDLYGVLSRCGLCKERASRYRAAFLSSNHASNTQSRHSVSNVTHNAVHRPSAATVFTLVNTRGVLSRSNHSVASTSPHDTRKLSDRSPNLSNNAIPNTADTGRFESDPELRERPNHPEREYLLEPPSPEVSSRQRSPKASVSRRVRSASEYTRVPLGSDTSEDECPRRKQSQSTIMTGLTYLSADLETYSNNMTPLEESPDSSHSLDGGLEERSGHIQQNSPDTNDHSCNVSNDNPTGVKNNNATSHYDTRL